MNQDKETKNEAEADKSKEDSIEEDQKIIEEIIKDKRKEREQCRLQQNQCIQQL